MTVNQYRVFDALLKHATDQYKVDPARLWYTISIAALSSKIGLESSHNTSYIKNIVDELVTFGVNWDYLAGLNKGEWNTSALLAGAKLSKGGMLSYHYAANLRELFMNPEMWAWVDFRIMKRFSRAATPPVYQNVLRYASLGKTPVLSVDVWRDLILGIAWRKGSYKVYKEFKRAVLQRALDEINVESDHTFELVELKEGGRAVTSLQFIIKKKVKQEAIEAADFDVISAMKRLGVPYSEARKLLAQHGAEAVNVALSYLERRQGLKLQPVANVPAYFRNVLKMGYTFETPQDNLQKALPQSKKAATRTSEELTSLFLADRRVESQRYFAELESAEQAALVERYNMQQPSPDLKIESAEKMKKIVSTAFFSWVANDTWGEPTDSDMLRFVIERARVTI